MVEQKDVWQWQSIQRSREQSSSSDFLCSYSDGNTCKQQHVFKRSERLQAVTIVSSTSRSDGLPDVPQTV